MNPDLVICEHCNEYPVWQNGKCVICLEKEGKIEDFTIKPHNYTGSIIIENLPMDGKNVNEVWCTFPNALLQNLPDEQKKEMFQRIQRVIDEYSINSPLVES